jgi:hypothetical protein
VQTPSRTRTQRSTRATNAGRSPRRSSSPTTGRFTRGATGRSPGAGSRRRVVAGGWLQRSRPQQQSRRSRAMSGVAGALPGLGVSRSGGPRSAGKVKRGGKAGGVAFLTAAAGMAFKNRDKLASMFRRDRSHSDVASDPPPEPETAGIRDEPMNRAASPPARAEVDPTSGAADGAPEV